MSLSLTVFLLITVGFGSGLDQGYVTSSYSAPYQAKPTYSSSYSAPASVPASQPYGSSYSAPASQSNGNSYVTPKSYGSSYSASQSYGSGIISVSAWLINHVVYDTGVCGLNHAALNFAGAAIPKSQFNSNMCGQCIQVSNPYGRTSSIAQIFDHSGTAELFLSWSVFFGVFPNLQSRSALPPLSPVTYQVIACPSGLNVAY